MSLNAYARCLSQFEIAAIKRNPAAAVSMAATGTLGRLRAGTPNLVRNVALLRDRGGNGGRASPVLRQELERQIAEADAVPRRQADSSRMLDLHKSWHVLHFLFTGLAAGGTPPADALLGGREIGDDMGYGPPRLHEPAAVTAFARFLAPLTVAELQRRIDPRRMRALGIYCCDDADAASAEEIGGDVALHFPRLQAFAAAAAETGNGLLMWLS